jgi:hypothetical protein
MDNTERKRCDFFSFFLIPFFFLFFPPFLSLFALLAGRCLIFTQHHVCPTLVLDRSTPPPDSICGSLNEEKKKKKKKKKNNQCADVPAECLMVGINNQLFADPICVRNGMHELR